MKKINTYFLLILMIVLASCHSKIKERKDEIYSRHLQKHISLAVISTPVPTNKSDFNLLLLNDGQDIEKLRVKEILDSLYRKKLIQPLIVVAIKAFDRKQEYGVSGKTEANGNGAFAEKYAGFITGELLPFVKKKAAVRKFKSITLAGSELGGLSAFDVAWDNADKIDKVGVFSGSFDVTNKETNKSDSSVENRIIINKIRSSRKRPHLQYWFYAGENESANDTKDLIDVIKKKNFINEGDITFLEDKNGSNDYDSWSHAFGEFLLWAEGK
jgi:enterochelin esterase-like enzyme